jgi:hypothetical protein
MRRILFCFVLLLVPAAAQAQHYCDTTPATTGSAVQGASMTVSLCLDAPSTAAVTSFNLYDNSATAVPITMTKGTTSPVSNKTLFTGAYTAPQTLGVRTIQTSALNGAVEGAKSPAFTLTVTAFIPNAPTNLTVK